MGGATLFFIVEFVLALTSDFGKDFYSVITQIDEFFFPTLIISGFYHQKPLLIDNVNAVLIVINLILSFLLIVNIILIFGITKKRHTFLLPWLVFHIMIIVASTTISGLIIYIPFYYQHYNLISILQNSVILILMNVLGYYFWFLVFSTYRHIKKENRSLLLLDEESISSKEKKFLENYQN